MAEDEEPLSENPAPDRPEPRIRFSAVGGRSRLRDGAHSLFVAEAVHSGYDFDGARVERGLDAINEERSSGGYRSACRSNISSANG